MSRSLLTVFAHPDDAETAVGGSLLKWIAEGWNVTLCVITDGDKGTNDPGDEPATVVARRRLEQERAAALLGARVIYLGYEDGALQPTLELRRDLVRVMRRVRPDRVVANDPTVWFRHGLYINHPDHRAAGQALVEAVYPAVKKPGIFPELLAEGLHPHVVEEVWLAPTDEPDTWVDIADVLERKISLICEHSSQFAPEPTRRAFTRIAAASGQPRGLAAAEAFRTLRLAANTVRALAGDRPE
jgi:LmbE family N-acetylglucosaminyl deacetylase